jgi:hypothetical protein
MSAREIVRNLLIVGAVAGAGGACTTNNYYDGGAPTPASAAGQPTSPDGSRTIAPAAGDVCVADNYDIPLVKGETYVYKAKKSLIQGDVTINGHQPDSIVTTGQIGEVNSNRCETITIFADNDGDAQVFADSMTQGEFERQEGSDIEAMKTPGKGGCGLKSGCPVVEVVKIGN